MSARVVLHLQSPGWSNRYQLATWAVTAAAAGDAPLVVLWFEPLVRFVEGRFDEAEREGEALLARNAAALRMPPPAELLRQARELGARLVACETAARIAGVEVLALEAAVDEVLGLQQLLQPAKEARHVAWL